MSGGRARGRIMNRFFSLLAALALAFVLAAPPAEAQDPVRGRALAKEFCADCHAIGRRGRSPVAGAMPFWSLGRSYDLDRFDERLESGISAGHPDMPEFKFDRADALAMQAYLRAIQR